MGGRSRWRTMPWMVVMFGVLVVPLGIVSIVLVMLQPIAVGAWCALCLVTAAAMLIMVAPAVDEVVAMSQFLQGARREGKPFWWTFWVGGSLDQDRHAPLPSQTTGGGRRSIATRIVSAMDLDNVPWNLVLVAASGVWLMATPAVLGTTGASADVEHLAGALVLTWAVIAFGEIVRPVRLLNVLVGLGVAAAPWLVLGTTDASRWNDVVVGVAVVMLSLPRGRIQQQFGDWNPVLVW